jgi:hypothetical protein
MCKFETYTGGCNGCPFENEDVICKLGLIEIHKLFLYTPDKPLDYDVAVIKKRKRALMIMNKGGVNIAQREGGKQ